MSVTTYGKPHTAAVAATQQAIFAAYRKTQSEAEKATAEAETQVAEDAAERAAKTREATERALFWNNTDEIKEGLSAGE